MEEMPYARYVLPALLVLLAFGSFLIIATSGSDQPPVRPLELPARSAPNRGTGKRTTVTVRAGDSASAIAERAGITVDRLKALNPDVTLDALRPGQRLRLAR
jgi:LysM domain-containing protein